MLIFLDLETTGLELEDKICSIAIVYGIEGKVYEKYELLNEGKKIPAKASSINHITNEMIKEKPKFKESEIYQFLREYNSQETTIVGHNVTFDIKKLKDSGFDFKGSVIDTLRASKHLIPECESYALQFLRYELKLYKNEVGKVNAHHALGDAKVVKLLYEYLLESVSQEEMYELSFKNVLMEKFSFGKYSGRYIEEIVAIDRGYLEWMLSTIDNLDEDLGYSINYYLRSASF